MCAWGGRNVLSLHQMKISFFSANQFGIINPLRILLAFLAGSSSYNKPLQTSLAEVGQPEVMENEFFLFLNCPPQSYIPAFL